jgi:hypothetical protein
MAQASVCTEGLATRYGFGVAASTDLNLTISFEHPDEEGWIVAQVLEVPAR